MTEQVDTVVHMPKSLKASDLVKGFLERKVLVQLSLEAQSGEFILIIGGNGSGKTTLLEILSGHLSADSGSLAVRNGLRELILRYRQSRFNPITQWRRPGVIARYGVRRLWQDSRLFPSLTLLENLMIGNCVKESEHFWRVVLNPLRALRHESMNRSWAVGQLSLVGLGHRRDSSGGALSLGQEKRAVIGRTLASGGMAVLLDEPLSGLDHKNQDLTLQFIARFMADPTTFTIATEHRSVMAPLLGEATRIHQLNEGRLESCDSSGDSSGASRHWRSVLEPYLPASVLDSLRCSVSHLAGGGCILRLRNLGEEPGDCALDVVNLQVKGRKFSRLGWNSDIREGGGLSMSMAYGEAGVLLAPNGWGKTTLLEAIAGIHRLAQGSIRVSGRDVSSHSIVDRVKAGIRLIRARDTLFSSLSVREILKLAGGKLPPSLQRLQWQEFGRLSGGEKKRIGLRTLGSATVQMIDEPFAGLDSTGISEAWELLAPRRNAVRLITIPGQLKGE